MLLENYTKRRPSTANRIGMASTRDLRFLNKSRMDQMRECEDRMSRQYMRRHSVAENQLKLRQQEINFIERIAIKDLNRDLKLLRAQTIRPSRAVIRVEKAPQQPAVKDVRFKSLMDALVPPKTVSQEKTENRIPNGLDGRRASV